MHFHLTVNQAVQELVMFYFEDGHGNSVDNPNQNLDIESMCLAFEISPLQLVDLLNNDSAQPRLRTSEETAVKAWIKCNGLYGAEDIGYFTQEMVNRNITIHYEEVYSWVICHPELFMPEETEKPKDKIQAHIDEFESQREENRRRADEAEKQVTAAPQEIVNPNLTPAQRAAQAKSEKHLATWKQVFPAMMKVYHRCMEEGKKPRQKQDFYAMFNELDAELTDSQLAFFRSCLPEGYSDSKGGKYGKI